MTLHARILDASQEINKSVAYQNPLTECKLREGYHALSKHRKCALLASVENGDAIKHFRNARRAPSKKNLTCKYLTRELDNESRVVSNRSSHGLLVNDDQSSIQPVDFPTMLFLDPSILRNGQVEISAVDTPVAEHILQILGEMPEIYSTASNFFNHIHLWMPFISKKRFFEIYLRPAFHIRSDIVLLLLSIKLITTLPPAHLRSPRTQLYLTVKHFYLEVEGSSAFSILVLQAGVLLALYELGHGIYPAAFLSIGACARYAYAIGINVSRAMGTRRALTMVEVEERRRVWWAIIILDRFVSIGCPGRPFATADPKFDDPLPADDAAWDHGTVKLEDSSTLSSPMAGHMSKFALLCQAANLLGQVLNQASSDSALRDKVWIQLDRTLMSMATASLNVDSPDYDQITFIYSALIALYGPWLYSDGVDTVDIDRTQQARVVIQEITERVSTNLLQRQCFLNRNPETMSPWGLFFAYHICGVHLRSGRQTSESCLVVESLKETFLAVDARWKVAGIYLQLLEAQEIAHKYAS